LDEANPSRSAFAPYAEVELRELLQHAPDPQRLLLQAELLVAAVTEWPKCSRNSAIRSPPSGSVYTLLGSCQRTFGKLRPSTPWC
jgi:hypothetical protein